MKMDVLKTIQFKIYEIRGESVMLDRDLSVFNNVEANWQIVSEKQRQ